MPWRNLKFSKNFILLETSISFILTDLIQLDGDNGEDGDILLWQNQRYNFGEINSFGEITKLNKRIRYFTKVITITWRLVIIFT